MRRYIPMHVMIQLYEAFIRPHLEYCAPILIAITKSLSNKLEDANYYILRTLLGLPKSTTYDSVLISTNTRTLEQRKVFSCFDPTFLKVSIKMVLVTLKISLNFVQSIIILEAQALSLSKVLLQ